MTPQEFINKWRNVELKERSASQSHFNDLCRMLGLEDPISADPKGEWFTFEKGASKTSGGEGWADVWRRNCFAWEYQGKRKDLDRAFAQLQQYAIALENPPLLIVSDMDRIRIHTNWTNTVQWQSIGCLCGQTIVLFLTAGLLPSPPTTTRPSASCTRAFTNSGRCGWARSSGWATTPAIPPPQPSKPSPSQKA
ncbi:type IIL restriction-modification enzyme MmeI [Paracoccus beibuensis]|uniref:type IIL restriction-modification enzyme MmeI n=1 Tax=Paracoccus beibuensis TaxID=547602 RepID=UPI00223FCCA8|nr:type IIL restriction-modification enzyme MmeI [Paracoccus beibuensis]